MEKIKVNRDCPECDIAHHVPPLSNNDNDFCHTCCIDDDCDSYHSSYSWE